MTLEQIALFEEQWPALRGRLVSFLTARGIRPPYRDDVIQETATRLVAMWDDVMTDRPLWPLAKTIALNIVRDGARKGQREVLGPPTEAPSVAAADDAASRAIARIELAEVARALDELSPAHRAILLAQVDEDSHETRGRNADKMLRMRARRRLEQILKGLPAYLPARLRTTDLSTLLGGLRDVAVSGAACLLCLGSVGDVAPLRSFGVEPPVPAPVSIVADPDAALVPVPLAGAQTDIPRPTARSTGAGTALGDPGGRDDPSRPTDEAPQGSSIVPLDDTDQVPVPIGERDGSPVPEDVAVSADPEAIDPPEVPLPEPPALPEPEIDLAL